MDATGQAQKGNRQKPSYGPYAAASRKPSPVSLAACMCRKSVGIPLITCPQTPACPYGKKRQHLPTFVSVSPAEPREKALALRRNNDALTFTYASMAWCAVRCRGRVVHVNREGKKKRASKALHRRVVVTCLSCMDPMSPSPSSNSTSRESQKLVEPSFTWKAMFLPPYLHAVLQPYIYTNATRKFPLACHERRLQSAREKTLSSPHSSLLLWAMARPHVRTAVFAESSEERGKTMQCMARSQDPTAAAARKAYYAYTRARGTWSSSDSVTFYF
jgi:hypothetical protein